MRHNERSMLALVAIVVAFGAACGGHVEEEMGRAAVSEAMQPSAVDTIHAAALEDELIVARLNEWGIALEPDTIQAGHITFRVRNMGRLEHAFEVEGQDGEWVVELITPGEERTLTVDLTPGTYRIYCPLDDEHGDHDQRGMVSTLVVR